MIACHSLPRRSYHFFFFFNDTATTEIYTLSLHDALPICGKEKQNERQHEGAHGTLPVIELQAKIRDRKSTRLNSSHLVISYAVFCLKKKKARQDHHPQPGARLRAFQAHPRTHCCTSQARP